MPILITGAAGFIGFHVAQALLSSGKQVIGIDNLNDYYDVNLKYARIDQLQQRFSSSNQFTFYRLDIADRDAMATLADQQLGITHIIHLAAQAGVRYSITNPHVYVESNLMGHVNILELARALTNFEHLVYASSSSVYGANTKLPFSIEDRVDTPISLYAATKKSNELMSYCYSHLYSIPTTGLRYFTVYGPWGRPDMAAFIFTKAILEGKPLHVFNEGKMRRNFTYIDDVVQGTINCLYKPPSSVDNQVPAQVYNIGNNRSEELMDFIKTLEVIIGKSAQLKLEPMQDGDVKETVADISASTLDFGFMPKINVQEGLANFVAWYKDYYGIDR
ncbi:MAG: NAD-dependent epimerase [Gammaproteobacteria bacterium]